MSFPRIVADTLARLAQKAPGSSRQSPETAFTEIPAATANITIPTRHGHVPATLYSPPSGGTEKGIYVNFHGGGFVMRHPEQDDPLCRYLAANADVAVLNVDYTPAPQSRFPGPVEQAYDVAMWATDRERSWDVSKCAVGGQSAGGALAAGASRLAWENGQRSIGLQVLMYPPLDLTIPAAKKRAEGKETFLARMGPIFDVVYCPDEQLRRDRLISPAGRYDTASLDGIAPALIVTCGKDILQAEGARYAARLEQAGSLIDHIDLSDVGHGFNILGASREVVLPVYGEIAKAVRKQFSSAA